MGHLPIINKLRMGALAWYLAIPLVACSTSFTRIAGSGDILDGATTGIVDFGGYVSWSMRDHEVAFFARASGQSPIGIYKWSPSTGNIQVAAVNDSIEGGGTISSGFGSSTAILNGEVYFIAAKAPLVPTLFKADGTSISQVLSAGAAVSPSGSLTGFSGGGLNVDASGVTFLGSMSSTFHIFRYNWSTLSAVASQNQHMPGSTATFGHMNGFGPPSISNGNVVFSASGTGGFSGVYLHNGLSLLRLVDDSMAAPDTGTSYSSLHINAPMMDGDKIAFAGYRNGANAHYTWRNNAVTSVASPDASYPGHGMLGTLGQFNAIHGNHVAFTSNLAAWVWTGERLIRVLSNGSQIGGRTIVQIEINGRSLGNNRLLMELRFSDDTRALYLAEGYLATNAHDWEMYK